MQRDAAACADAELPPPAGERTDGGVHCGQVLPGQVQDEAALPPPTLPSGTVGRHRSCSWFLVLEFWYINYLLSYISYAFLK